MLLRRACLQRFFTTTTTSSPKRPVVLTILDGWGYREDPADNAVLLGHTPHFDALFGHHSARGQVGFLDACERDVGLPVGQIGNSEVGHMNIGAGRIVWQDICAIDNVVAKEALLQQEALQEHIEILQQNGGTCHLLGLVSPGGVHAMQDHMVAVANTVHAAGVPVVVHAFTDGRDVPPNDAIRTFPSFLEGLMPGVTVGSVTGRYYAMDRDNRWERVVTAFDVIVAGQGVAPSVETAMDAIHNAYQADLSDEFILPTVVGDYTGMKPGDGVFMANFRSDRAREILTALADANAYGDDHDGEYEELHTLMMDRDPPTDQQPVLSTVTGMVQYSDRHNEFMTSVFPPKDITNSLGEVVSKAGLTQLRAAETEKYPHVTFFFNGGREQPFAGEDRILVPSPKVATYDLQPEMSCPEVGTQVVAALDTNQYDVAIVNFANPDMVGHTGDLAAAVKAVESVDVELGKIQQSVQALGGVLLVTADHGNCEKMYDRETNVPHTAHTLNKVPFMVCDYSGTGSGVRVRSGRLADIAPTMLKLLGLEQPKEMDGACLFVDEEAFEQEHPRLQDGKRMVRPPREGNVEAGSSGV